MIAISPGSPRRTAISLVEVVVVIGIMGILISLILPAVQQARAAADRLSCQSRLRQIGLALHGYHDTHGMFPPGQDYGKSPFGTDDDGSLTGLSWLAKILPFVEQQPLWEQTVQALKQDRVPWHNPPHVGLATVIPLYTCPADPRVASPQRGPYGILAAYTSFVGVRGEFSGMNNGALPYKDAVRFADITDGSSQTAIVGERPPSAKLGSGWWYTDYIDYRLPSHPAYAHDFILSAVELAQWPGDCIPPIPPGAFVFGPGRLDNDCDRFHFWSLHTGGANFAFADGSVRFLPYSISPMLRALASRNGGEVVDVP